MLQALYSASAVLPVQLLHLHPQRTPVDSSVSPNALYRSAPSELDSGPAEAAAGSNPPSPPAVAQGGDTTSPDSFREGAGPRPAGPDHQLPTHLPAPQGPQYLLTSTRPTLSNSWVEGRRESRRTAITSPVTSPERDHRDIPVTAVRATAHLSFKSTVPALCPRCENMKPVTSSGPG